MSYDWTPDDDDLCAELSRRISEAVGDDIARAGAIHGALTAAVLGCAAKVGDPAAVEAFNEGHRVGLERGRQLALRFLGGEGAPS